MTYCKSSGLPKPDIELIEKSLRCNDWNDVIQLINLAETEQAKEFLNNRKLELYRREEYDSGLL